jgi:hypothetical protein
LQQEHLRGQAHIYAGLPCHAQSLRLSLSKMRKS